MGKFISFLKSLFVTWFSSDYSVLADVPADNKKGIDWAAAAPFILFHLMCFGIIWVGWSPFAVIFAAAFYVVRMFGITAFYHRYFAHRAFKSNRFFTFLFAFLGCSAMQKGPLWWAAIHRHHHIYADTKDDIHSPKIHGFLWSHIGWILAHENKRTRVEYIKDWQKFPEIVFIDKFALAIPFVVAVGVFLLGHVLFYYAPWLHTNGMQLLVWGVFVSTVVCSHATFSINSIDHMFGSRRYEMPNTSRNNVLMAILTLGEGWHNNHHHYAITARAGFYWWEIDITYYVLVILSWIGIVKDLRPLPKNIRDSGQYVKTAPPA
ncbi:MAG: acyl-CoA desaturase [Spirochaetes bacterium]|nr:acyl-CoA desaturase [Spirochaetota bacterium]